MILKIQAITVLTSILAATSCKTTKSHSSSVRSAEAQNNGDLGLNQSELQDVATKKATCPFVGSAVATNELPPSQSKSRPLASIETMIQLGDSGGGDLGSKVLAVFANGNHAFMRGSDSSAKLDTPVPAGTFSLDFPGSQGSHPGHSGILQGNPNQLDSGRFDQNAFSRFLGYSNNGVIKRSDVGRFIASNLFNDPSSKVFGPGVAKLLGGDILAFSRQIGPTFLEHLKNAATGDEDRPEFRNLFIALTKITGEDNLIGSAGEFGLLLAFLEKSPKTRMVDGEPAISVEDVTQMFRDHQLPDHWREWPKTAIGWVKDTTGILLAATKHYLFLKASGGSPAINSQICSFKTSAPACVRGANQQLVPVDAGTISTTCAKIVSAKLGQTSADSWNCRAACFSLTMDAQTLNCPQ